MRAGHGGVRDKHRRPIISEPIVPVDCQRDHLHAVSIDQIADRSWQLFADLVLPAPMHHETMQIVAECCQQSRNFVLEQIDSETPLLDVGIGHASPSPDHASRACSTANAVRWTPTQAYLVSTKRDMKRRRSSMCSMLLSLPPHPPLK